MNRLKELKEKGIKDAQALKDKAQALGGMGESADQDAVLSDFGFASDDDDAEEAVPELEIEDEDGQEELEELLAAGIDPDWIVGIPHPELFSRFCASLEVDPGEAAHDAVQVVSWREMFLDVLRGSPAQAIGALGLGTESVVSTMYQQFLPALEHLGISPRDAVFFPLHAKVDERHQATLLEIAVRFAETPEGRRDLEKGMHKALFLRAGFWDWMLGRASDPSAVGDQP